MAQDGVKIIERVSPIDSPTNETIMMDKKNVDVAEKASTPVTDEPANTTEEHEKQVDEKVKDEIMIDTKKTKRSNQPRKYKNPQKGIE